jgi:hypothetical protein
VAGLHKKIWEVDPLSCPRRNAEMRIISFIVQDQIDSNSINCRGHGEFLCRDCLVHLSLKEVFMSIQNIKASGSKFLLMTTFPEHKKNYNTITGAWRFINFETSPFNFHRCS